MHKRDCPTVDQLQWVPENLAVKGDACACYRNTDEAGQRDRNRNY
jgi:hypothetical protein